MSKYQEESPLRIRLLDVFLVFLVVVGVLQFAYCVIGGNYVSIGCSGGGSEVRVWANEGIAIQCFPGGLLGDGGPVCAHSEFEDAVCCGEQEGVYGSLAREVRPPNDSSKVPG